MADSKDIPMTVLRECFDADLKRGMLFWRERPLGHFADQRAWKIFNTQFAGKRAGTAQMNKGYHVINFNGVGTILVHRIVWALAHGQWPEREIDHINGDTADNRLVNLREAVHRENSYNVKARMTNKSGLKGVCLDKRRGLWRATISSASKHCQHLGYFPTPEEAHRAYCAASERLHGEFGRLQ